MRVPAERPGPVCCQPSRKGVNTIKVFKWAGRIVAILAVVMAIMIAASGSWGDAIYALLLAAVVWFWTDALAARWSRSKQGRASR